MDRVDVKGDRKRVILVLNFKDAYQTNKCLRSLNSDPGIMNWETIVIDNESTDESVEAIRAELPSLRILRNETNLGYADAYNRAIGTLMGEDVDAFLLLNNDTIVRPGSLGLLIETLRSSESVGIVGPAVLDMGTDTIQSLGAIMVWSRGDSTLRSMGSRYGAVAHRVEEADYVSGCALLVRREVFSRAGLFPTGFFMYSEEVDLCLRAAKLGFKVLCDPRAVVEHKKESTSSKFPALKLRLMFRNRFLILKRHGTSVDMLTAVVWIVLVDLVVRSFRGSAPISTCRSKLRGVIEGLLLAMNEPRIRAKGDA